LFLTINETNNKTVSILHLFAVESIYLAVLILLNEHQ